MEIRKTFRSTLSRSVLYQAWVSPEMTIEPVVKIESDPKINGHFKLYSKSEHGEGVMSGKFIEVEQDKKLKYTWHWEESPEKTEVTVEFLENAGRTTVELMHKGFTTIESKEMHDAGWDHYFKSLEDKIKQTN
ncbi:MAG: SRPBCC domain-containing protein [Vicingaceae bacterium]